MLVFVIILMYEILLYQFLCSLWEEGILVRMLSSALSSTAESSGSSGNDGDSKVAAASHVHWFILEGTPTPGQMDALASCCHENTLTLSNGHSVFLDPSIRFILEVQL